MFVNGILGPLVREHKIFILSFTPQAQFTINAIGMLKFIIIPIQRLKMAHQADAL